MSSPGESSNQTRRAIPQHPRCSLWKRVEPTTKSASTSGIENSGIVFSVTRRTFSWARLKSERARARARVCARIPGPCEANLGTINNIAGAIIGPAAAFPWGPFWPRRVGQVPKLERPARSTGARIFYTRCAIDARIYRVPETRPGRYISPRLIAVARLNIRDSRARSRRRKTDLR